MDSPVVLALKILKLKLLPVEVASPDEFEKAFGAIRIARVDAIRVNGSPFIDGVEVYRNATANVDKILKGAKLGGLPVEQATATKTLGLTIPQSMLIRADEIIQ